MSTLSIIALVGGTVLVIAWIGVGLVFHLERRKPLSQPRVRKVCWNELVLGNPNRNSVVCITERQAIRDSRAAFQQARPGATDPRTDEEALEDFILMNWGWTA